MYAEYNAMLTAAVLEGLFYGDTSVFSVPYMIYSGVYNYVVAVPLLVLVQHHYMGNDFTFFKPATLQDVWVQKFHASQFW